MRSPPLSEDRTDLPPCPEEAKDEALRAVERLHGDFFDQLVLQVYNGYYTNLTVFESIGYILPSTPKPG